MNLNVLMNGLVYETLDLFVQFLGVFDSFDASDLLQWNSEVLNHDGVQLVYIYFLAFVIQIGLRFPHRKPQLFPRWSRNGFNSTI